MKARVIKDENGKLLILCSNGTIANATKKNLYFLLTSFRHVEELKGNKKNRWDKEYPEMSYYPGIECAAVTDTHQLLLSDFSPFDDIFTVKEHDSTMLSTAEYAKKMGKSIEQIKIHCRNGRIPGAVKYTRDWRIPTDAPYPVDKRVYGNRKR